MIHAGADGLHGKAHGLAGDRAEALKTQDVMGADHVRDLRGECGRISDFAAFHDEGFEFIVPMVVVIMVMMIVIVVVIIFVIVVVMVVMHFVTRF